MSAFYKFLFPMKPDGTAISLLLLALSFVIWRSIAFAWDTEVDDFESMSAAFPDPLGVGHSVSLALAIFGELFCSIGFILGALYRLAMIPMIFTMGVAFFVIHGNDPFSLKELAFVYLVIFYLDVYSRTW